MEAKLGKKEDIIIAAKSIFARHGLKKATVDDISKKASVSKATIYKYFRNKEEIFDEVVQVEADALWYFIREAVDRESTATGKLRARLFTKIGKVHELINLYGITRETWSEHRTHIVRVRDNIVVKDLQLVAEILRLGIKTNEFQTDKIVLLAHFIVVSLKPLEYPWELAELDISLSQFTDIMIDVMLNGIGKRQ